MFFARLKMKAWFLPKKAYYALMEWNMFGKGKVSALKEEAKEGELSSSSSSSPSEHKKMWCRWVCTTLSILSFHGNSHGTSTSTFTHPNPTSRDVLCLVWQYASKLHLTPLHQRHLSWVFFSSATSTATQNSQHGVACATPQESAVKIHLTKPAPTLCVYKAQGFFRQEQHRLFGLAGSSLC